MTTPYTYLIGWPEINKWYYGVRYAKNCQPNDLWNPYKTSSKTVKKLIKVHGDPPIRIVRKIFTSSALARSWEHKVLKRLKVIKNSKWINSTDNKAIEPRYGENHPNTFKKGINSPFFGIKRPHLSKIKQQEWLEKNPMHNECSKLKSITKRCGENHHMKRKEIKEKISGKNNWIYTTPGALEERRHRFIEMNKLKQGIKYEKIPCVYCNIDMPKNNYKRHIKLCKIRHID